MQRTLVLLLIFIALFGFIASLIEFTNLGLRAIPVDAYSHSIEYKN